MTSSYERSFVKVEQTEGGVFARLVNCEMLNEETIPPAKEQLLRVVEGMGPVRLMLNLGGVRFLSSTALGMLVALHKKAQAQSGSLTLCGVTPPVFELFEVTQLTRVLDIRPEDSVQGNV